MAARPSRAGPRPSRARAPAARPGGFPVLDPSGALGPIIALSREVSADMGEVDLFRLLQRTLEQLLPGRSIAIQTFDPVSLEPLGAIASGGRLLSSAARMPAAVKRGAIERTHLRPDLAASGRLRVVEEHPLVFEGSAAGTSIPLVAGGDLMAVLHVEYPRSRAKGALPLHDDEQLVIPLANHIAVATRMRRLLRETFYLQEYLEQLLEQANVLILAADMAGRITIWNQALAQLTGLPKDEALGREILPWATELGAPDIGLVVNQVASSGRPDTREVRLPSPGGIVLRAVFNVALVRAPSAPADGREGRPGELGATVAIGQDVTALRSLQGQMIHAEKLATVGQIAAGVAHEINNPLTSIQVCADALARKAASRSPATFDAADLDRARKIVEGADRIQRFARDLVAYARPSGAEVDVVSLNEIVGQALSFCEHVIAEASVEIERDLPAEIPPIYAVRDQILQVLINLVTNAAHAVTGRKGKIRIRTWAGEDATVSVAVSDDGVGIEESDRPHIFEPFFTTKAAGRGTGLGLSIVRNIVMSHGGHVSFQTRHGSGTTFVVTLPTGHRRPLDNRSQKKIDNRE